ncbi:MAG: hypothetical protein PVH19_13190, partial [Planctomycetia bacterium]
NHHVEFRVTTNKKGQEKWTEIIVTQFEAVQRKQQGLPVINNKDDENSRFLFSLTSGEYVIMKPDGQEKEDIYRITTVSAGDHEFVLHCDARPKTLREKQKARIRSGADKLRKWGARKVTVDPLGNILPAND